jgi:hypothetical protein
MIEDLGIVAGVGIGRSIENRRTIQTPIILTGSEKKPSESMAKVYWQNPKIHSDFCNSLWLIDDEMRRGPIRFFGRSLFFIVQQRGLADV